MPVTNPHGPWSSRAKAWTQSNTVQSVVFPLGICLALSVAGHAFPEYVVPEIVTAAEGGVVACLGALIWRFVVPRDRLQVGRKK